MSDDGHPAAAGEIGTMTETAPLGQDPPGDYLDPERLPEESGRMM